MRMPLSSRRVVYSIVEGGKTTTIVLRRNTPHLSRKDMMTWVEVESERILSQLPEPNKK